MADRRLQLDPALRIFHRRGRWFAWTPATEIPTSLDLGEMALLGAVLAGAVDAQFPETVIADPNGQDRRGVAAKAREAIGRLSDAGLFSQSEDATRIAFEFPAHDWQELPAAPSAESQGEYLKLNRSLCLLPGDGHWLAWSRCVSGYVRIPTDVALYMAQFGDGCRPDQVRAHREAEGDRARLVQGEFLIPTDPPETRAAATRVKDHKKAVSLGTGRPFRQVKPDHRTPVYFVTHSVDHLPLALGMMRAYLASCADGALLATYNLLPIVSMEPADMLQVYRRFGPGVWLFSDYMWSVNFNLEYSEAVKRLDSSNVTVHGGPSAPKYESVCKRFMESQPYVDIVVRGEGEITIADLLRQLDGETGTSEFGMLEAVAGITFYRDRHGRSDLIRTPERPRAVNVDEFPSPYLEGTFDEYGGQVVAAIAETNRGCPYACTFCDWGSATQQKIRRFDLDRVKAEIDWIGRNNIPVLWIADANFGVFKRDIEIARCISETKSKYGFPREVVVNYPKNATDKIAEIVQILVEAEITGQGIISIQSTDPTTLSVIKRSNIKTSKYDELGQIFRSQNLPLSTDLMIGLPGSTVESFKRDLQYYLNDDIGVKAYRTQLLPNSPMADPEYAKQYQIQTDDEAFLTSTSSYSSADLQEMLWIWTSFDIADGYSLLRYVVRYLQWDHGILATDFIHELSRHCLANPHDYPAVTWALRFFLDERYLPGGWAPFYREIAEFAERQFGVAGGRAFDTVLKVNSLMMPDEGRRFPECHELKHDVVAYFADNERQAGAATRPLSDYPAGQIEITDPFEMCCLNYEEIEQYDNHQVFFELEAPISRLRSNPSFVQGGAELREQSSVA